MKNLIKGTLSSMTALATLGATVFAQRGAQEAACVPMPASGLSVQALTGGIGYITAGGTGPILILAIAFVIGMIVSHIIWGGF